jgi:ABC-type molybdate transport system substrate-binding protein
MMIAGFLPSLRSLGTAAAIIAVLVAIHPRTGLAGSGGTERAQVLVLAASSLGVVADELEVGFEAAHPDIDLQFLSLIHI